MPNASAGALTKFAMEPLDGVFDASSEPYEFINESIRKRAEILDTEGIRGTRSRHSARTRSGNYTVAGTVLMHPSPADLDLILPRIMGAAESVDSFVLGDDLDSFRFGVMVDRIAKVFTYAGCLVNKATFRSVDGGLMELELDIIGKTESVGASGTFPALTLGTAANNAPYVHSDCTWTSSGTKKAMAIEIVIDNKVESRWGSGSRTATSLVAMDRIVSVKITAPYTSDETALYEQAAGGVTGSVVYTNGGMSTTFTFGVLQVPDVSPVVNGKGEVVLEIEGICRMTGSTKELVITHDSVA